MDRMKAKAVAGILVVFLLGVLIGGLGGNLYFQREFQKFKKGGSDLHREVFMDVLTRELDLTDEQTLKVSQVINKTEVIIRQYLQDSHEEFMKIIEDQQIQLEALLTPEQQEKLKIIVKRMREHAPPPPPGPPFSENLQGKEFDRPKPPSHERFDGEGEARPESP